MKIFVLLFFLTNLFKTEVHAGVIYNKSRSAFIEAVCVELDIDNSCTHYKIMRQRTAGEETLIAHYFPLKNNQFESIDKKNKEKFDYFPLTKKVWQCGDDPDSECITAQVLVEAASIPLGGAFLFTFVGLIPEGPILLGVSAGVLALPTVLDVASLPIRAAAKGTKQLIKQHKSNKLAKLLNFLTQQPDIEKTYSNRKFIKIINDLKNIESN
jgi:hypothetical protein